MASWWSDGGGASQPLHASFLPASEGPTTNLKKLYNKAGHMCHNIGKIILKKFSSANLFPSCHNNQSKPRTIETIMPVAQKEPAMTL